MAYSEQTKLVYIPVTEVAVSYNDRGIDRAKWAPRPGQVMNIGVNADLAAKEKGAGTSSLLAWDPVQQKQVWRLPTPSLQNGGVMASAGGLVFQGQIDGRFSAYDARTGARLWSFAAQAPVLGPPISYSVNGRQYVTVLAGLGTSVAAFGPMLKDVTIDHDYRTQARRVLTLAIGGKAWIPASQPFVLEAPADPSYRPDPALAKTGEAVFNNHCVSCHGLEAIAGGNAPDLRGSSIPQVTESFAGIVHGGGLVPAGMPRFSDLTDAQLAALRQYVRARADEVRRMRE